jgi:hypothetical protein
MVEGNLSGAERNLNSEFESLAQGVEVQGVKLQRTPGPSGKQGVDRGLFLPCIWEKGPKVHRLVGGLEPLPGNLRPAPPREHFWPDVIHKRSSYFGEQLHRRRRDGGPLADGVTGSRKGVDSYRVWRGSG